MEEAATVVVAADADNDDAATEEEVDGGARKRDITLASAREREGRERCSPAPPWMEPRPGPATPCWGSWIEGQSR
jgi:hypothetical protein